MARIDLDHIRHAYGPNPKSDADYALKEVHYSFAEGGAYALLGPSGCGKTTLLNIISGLIHPSHGRLLFDGLLKQGATKTFQDSEKINLVLGDAGAIDLYVNGKKIEDDWQPGAVERLTYTKGDPQAG